MVKWGLPCSCTTHCGAWHCRNGLQDASAHDRLAARRFDYVENHDDATLGPGRIGELPWGTHFCQFYQTPQDLLEVLVGYFQQGLQNNEFCLWVTSEPLGVEDATQALRRVVPDLDERIRKGQIEFHGLPAVVLSRWPNSTPSVCCNTALRKNVPPWHKATKGCVSPGNASWLDEDDWKAFTDYEATVSTVIGSHRMLALCTYSLDKCKGVEMFDVLRNHPLALVKKEGKWEVIQSPQHRKTTEALQTSERRQKAILDTIPDPAWLKDKEGRFLAVNPAWCRFFGIDAKNVLGKTAFEFFPAEVAQRLSEEDRSIIAISPAIAT